MKKLGKILAVLLVMALVLTGIVLTVSADEPATVAAAPDAPAFLPESVTATPAETLTGFTYVVYASEADFNADLADGSFDGMANGASVLTSYGTDATFVMPTTSAYVYLLADVKTSVVFTIANTSTLQINCGGRALTVTSKQNNNYGKLAIFNGTFNDSLNANEGTFETGYNPSFAFRDLTFNMTSGYGSGRCIWARGSGCNVYLEGVTMTGNTRRFLLAAYNGSFNVVVKDSDINSKNGFVWLSNANALNVYLDAATRCSGLIYEGTLASGQAQTTIESGFMASATAAGSLESASVALNLNGAEFVDSGDATYGKLLFKKPDTLTPTFDASLAAEKGGFLVYESEMAFFLDFDADGKIDGSTAISSGAGATKSGDYYVAALPTSGYVYLLDNLNPSAQLSLSTALTVNCGGNDLKFTVKQNTLKTNAQLNILNGSLTHAANSTEGLFYTSGSNIALNCTDLEIASPNITYGSGRFFWVRGSFTATFVNCTIDASGSTAIFAVEDERNSTTNNIIFKNTDYIGGSNVMFALANNQTLNVTLDAESSIKATTIFSGTSNKPMTLTMELGARLNELDSMATAGVAAVYTEGGVATTDSGVKFALDGDMYLLQKPGSVSWYAKDGSLIRTDVLYTDGFNAPALGDMVITKTESGYTFATTAWTLDGEAFDLSARIEPGKTYELHEAESTAKAATLVLLENGVATNAWDITSLNDAFVAELPENATLLVLTDMAVVNGNVASYKNGVVIDLCDNTLTMDGYYFVTPAAGATVTIKNGKLVKSTNNVTVYGNAAGTLILNSVDITTPYSVAELKMGSLVMQLCNINSESTRPYYIGNGTATTNASLELLGIKHIMPAPSGAVFITLNGALGNISVRVADYEGVYSNIKAGYFFQFRDYGTRATEGVTKLNFEFENAYVDGYNNLVTGDITWSGAANPELTKENVSFTFNNFLGTRNDYFNDALLVAATVNVTKVKNTYKSMTDPEHDDYASMFVSPNPTDTGMMINLTLYSDFNLNLYIPEDTDIAGIKFGGEWLFYPAENIGTDEVVDGFYKVSIKNIAPNEAAKYVELSIWYANTATYLDGTTMSYYSNFTAKYSIVKYIASVIAEEDETIVSKAAKDNAMALAAYVKATYDFFTETAESDEAVMAQLEALVTEEVLAFVNGFVASDDENDFVNAKVNAVFTSNATTKLSLTFEDGVAWTVNGKSGVGGVYEINLRAYTLCDTLTITADGETATFSLGEYVATRIAQGANGTELAALQALYAYGMTAQALKPLN